MEREEKKEKKRKKAMRTWKSAVRTSRVVRRLELVLSEDRLLRAT